MSKPRNKTESPLLDRSGTASVELAIIVPVLILLIAGIIDVGRLFTDYETVSKSVRDATRFLSRVPISCAAAGTDLTPITNYLGDPADATVAQNLALTGSASSPTGPSDYLLPYWTDASTISMSLDCVTNNGSYDGVYKNVPYIPIIMVSANVPFSLLFGATIFNAAGITFVVSHSEASIGE